jgi:hypothetical protein
MLVIEPARKGRDEEPDGRQVNHGESLMQDHATTGKCQVVAVAGHYAPRPEERLAPPPDPRESGETQDRASGVLPHSAFRGQTPDEMYFGTGDAVPADLTSGAATARRTRVATNRSASCERCPSVHAAA